MSSLTQTFAFALMIAAISSSLLLAGLLLRGRAQK